MYQNEDAKKNGPPFDLTTVSELLPEDNREDVWTSYEEFVAYAATDSTLGTLNLDQIKEISQQ